MLSIEFLKTKQNEATELDKRAIDNLRPYLANRAKRGDLNADTLEILDESNYIIVETEGLKISRISIMKARRFAKSFSR